MVRYGALFLLISFIFAGCQSEESFSGKVGGINHGLSVGSKKLSVTVFQWEGGNKSNKISGINHGRASRDKTKRRADANTTKNHEFFGK